MTIYVVRPGDSIYSIANRFGVSPEKIISDNELTNPGMLVIGQTLVILQANQRHMVARGESIYSIAREYGVSTSAILAANPQIKNPSQLYVGQIIIIPEKKINYGNIDVNGYAFPNIDLGVLSKTLPGLTYLSIFSYQASPDGSLNTIQDDALISAARAQRVAPLMVVTNIREGGGFNSDVAHALLNNQPAQDNLINNILRVLKNKNYYGLDIDFEYLYPYDRLSYNNFLRRVARTIKPLGYILVTAIAPKLSASQKGILYEAHDYPVHGAVDDHVIIMTYEWGFTFSPPMAVAPINQVRKVLNYAVTAIPRNKIFMGIPNYGYDWTLPFKEGTAARTVTNVGAVDLAGREGAVIHFDPVSQAPHFNYFGDNGAEHEVWFEDARSIFAKLSLANEFRLGGVSYWTIGKYFPQNWLVLNSVYNVRKVL